MKRKILGILVCMLLLATIPLAAGMNNPSEQQPMEDKRTFVSGFIGFSRISGGGTYITFFAIAVRHGQMFGEYGMWRLQLVRFDSEFHGIIQAPFILGWFEGSEGW